MADPFQCEVKSQTARESGGGLLTDVPRFPRPDYPEEMSSGNRRNLVFGLLLESPFLNQWNTKQELLRKVDFDWRTLNAIFSGCLQSVFTKQPALQTLAIA